MNLCIKFRKFIIASARSSHGIRGFEILSSHIETAFSIIEEAKGLPYFDQCISNLEAIDKVCASALLFRRASFTHFNQIPLEQTISYIRKAIDLNPDEATLWYFMALWSLPSLKQNNGAVSM
jgi:hypothetical protein